MSVQLNHHIVPSHDGRATADWVAELFDLPASVPFGPFWVVSFANGVSLDFETVDQFPGLHYAFLVSDDEFTTIYAKLVDRDIPHWADSSASQQGRINTRDGGRGVYFYDPNRHFLEIITVPYGGWPDPT